jgi:asparagine synthetase B (glutamine-hydrolysing)
MCDHIRHRGPDDESFHIEGGYGIGMQRLSSIDLRTGHQPMSNEDDSVWGVFNGEIYNALRRDESWFRRWEQPVEKPGLAGTTGSGARPVA